ncbi:hypothetical protein WUBG_07576 [Wuchereria bancrofti]|uniref:Uncharacterized protein n=1 Tax=Wuchereria bancrofti TaxID=6293 RepID=J9EGC3_WUCBA|nr:hypothetical protein WUBG_07576 [Wuchereria bancrofti]
MKCSERKRFKLKRKTNIWLYYKMINQIRFITLDAYCPARRATQKKNKSSEHNFVPTSSTSTVLEDHWPFYNDTHQKMNERTSPPKQIKTALSDCMDVRLLEVEIW